MRPTSRPWLLFALLAASGWGAPLELPATDARLGLRPPNEHRLRVTVSKDRIAVRPLRSDAERKATALTDWTVDSADRQGRLITSLAAALAPPAADDPLAPRLFDSDVDGWAELWIDRGAPYELVALVMATVGQRCSLLAFAVKTPEGARTVPAALPDPASHVDESLTLAIGEEDVLVAAPGASQPRKLKRSPDAVRAAAVAFQKAHAKGRRPRRLALGEWRCLDEQGGPLDARRCWHGRVSFVAGGDLEWGVVLPLALAVQAVVPDVVFVAL